MGVKLFQSLGIDTYRLRDNSPKNTNQTEDNDWPRIESKVKNCTKCSLHKGRNKTVFGDGNRDADWFFVGEAPGKDEDLQGKPFVGRAGRLLTEVIFSIGLSREEVFIANILKCRPPDNRDPKTEEVEQCFAYLERQIDLVKPKIIIAVGRIAAQSLLGSNLPMGKLRGRIHGFGSSQNTHIGYIPSSIFVKKSFSKT